jgi:hypothetical protein
MEPFRDLTEYFGSGIFAVPWIALLCILPAAVVVAGIEWDSRRSPFPRSARRQARYCAALLSPATVVLPLFAWGMCLAIKAVRAPGFGLGVPKPRWIDWPLFEVATLALPVLVVGMLVLGLRAAFRAFLGLPDSVARDSCDACNYSLHGLPPNAPCPECGYNSPQERAP